MHPSPQNIALVKISDCLFFMNIQIRATVHVHLLFSYLID